MSRFARWIAFLIALGGVSAAYAQTAAIQNHCYLGGTKAQTSGLPSTNFQQGIIPSCTVTVFLTGTQTKATIFADVNNTPLSNPFTANTAGSVDPGGWLFFVAVNQGYDIVLSGGIPPNTYSQPRTLVDQFPGFSGVTQIVAGTNVQISPPSGTGAVTISSSGGGGGGGVGPGSVGQIPVYNSTGSVVGDQFFTETSTGSTPGILNYTGSSATFEQSLGGTYAFTTKDDSVTAAGATPQIALETFLDNTTFAPAAGAGDINIVATDNVGSPSVANIVIKAAAPLSGASGTNSGDVNITAQATPGVAHSGIVSITGTNGIDLLPGTNGVNLSGTLNAAAILVSTGNLQVTSSEVTIPVTLDITAPALSPAAGNNCLQVAIGGTLNGKVSNSGAPCSLDNVQGDLPTATAGTGAGTSPTITVVTGSTAAAGWVQVVTGSSPVASSPVVTVNLIGTGTLPNVPRCSISPANVITATQIAANTAFIPQTATTATGFAITVGATALSGSTTYVWGWQCTP